MTQSDLGPDFTKPSPARMYDYWLGGKDNFAVDREAAAEILQHAPDADSACRANRAFVGRAVRHVVGRGVLQFIDIGTGLPTAGNAPEAAAAASPGARTICVDNDPVVVSHGRALLPRDGTTAVVEADMRDPQAILAAPETRRLIDFTQPVAVVFAAVLHFVRDEENPAAIVAAFRERIATGSYLIISHDTTEGHPPELLKLGEDVYSRATAPMIMRSPQAILRFFDGFELAEPGLVAVNEWRPESLRERQERGGHWLLCGVGQKNRAAARPSGIAAG